MAWVYPQYKERADPSTYDNLPAREDLGGRPFLGMLVSKDSFYAGVFHSPKHPWVWIPQKRGQVIETMWAGGITAVFSEHPLSLKNFLSPGCHRKPMGWFLGVWSSDVRCPSFRICLQNRTFEFLSDLCCAVLGCRKHQTPEDSVHKEQAKSHERSWDDKISNQKKDLCRDHPRNKGLIRPF